MAQNNELNGKEKKLIADALNKRNCLDVGNQENYCKVLNLRWTSKSYTTTDTKSLHRFSIHSVVNSQLLSKNISLKEKIKRFYRIKCTVFYLEDVPSEKR